MYKTKGLAVVANDRLRFFYHTARAIIENKSVRLSEEDIEALIADNPKAGSFVRDHFAGIFFARGVHGLIDTIRANSQASKRTLPCLGPGLLRSALRHRVFDHQLREGLPLRGRPDDLLARPEAGRRVQDPPLRDRSQDHHRRNRQGVLRGFSRQCQAHPQLADFLPGSRLSQRAGDAGAHRGARIRPGDAFPRSSLLHYLAPRRGVPRHGKALHLQLRQGAIRHGRCRPRRTALGGGLGRDGQ